jgi:peptidoglycan hydrolase-like protein with peptidoglycan-binding domain
MGRCVLVAVVAALALAGTANAANPQSAGLQVALRAQGLYRGAIDSIAGPQTVAAVRAFQRQEGLKPTGLADKRTRRALGPLGRPLFGARVLVRGNFGWDVAVLQFLLARQGLTSPINAYFDKPTLHAVKRFQRKVNLVPDGVVGPATIAALGLQSRVPTPARAPLVSGKRTYKVREGDSLTAIAKSHGTTVSALARLNHLNPQHFLIIGRRLRLPAAVTRSDYVHVASTSDAFAIRESLGRWAVHYGVDPHLARALAWMESGFQQHVRSSVGAEGVMQLLPSTWEYVETSLIRQQVPHTADGNVRVGLAYLSHLLKTFGGNERLALAGWYQGERAVRKHGLYDETKPFVEDVLALRTRM